MLVIIPTHTTTLWAVRQQQAMILQRGMMLAARLSSAFPPKLTQLAITVKKLVTLKAENDNGGLAL